MKHKLLELYTTRQQDFLKVREMLEYENFNVGIDYYSSPFWNVIRKTEKAIGNVPYSSAWTNVSKFDLNETRAFGEIEIAISSLDDVLLHEIGIIQLKVCIFFTGPDFDWRIKKIFKEVKFLEIEDHNMRAFSQLNHPDLPEMSFRSYHPNYLRRSGKERAFLKFIENKFK